MGKLRVMDLFSGIGGFSLGLERTGGFETVAFCEIEDYPRRVLAKHWPEVPIFQDVRNLKGSDVGTVDVICGGYPCQPFSTAGQRRGAGDDRHLCPEFNRLVAELRPTWVIGENVAGHISMGLDDVLSDLEGQGYACRTFVIPACAIGAPHRRDRTWVIGNSDMQLGKKCETVANHVAKRQPDFFNGSGGTMAHATHMQRDGKQPNGKTRGGQIPQLGAGSCANDVAHAKRGRRPRPRQPVHTGYKAANGERKATEPFDGGQRGKRGAQPGLGGVFDGLSYWMDEPRERVSKGTPNRSARLKALGNAVVPQIPEIIGHAILQAEGAA